MPLNSWRSRGLQNVDSMEVQLALALAVAIAEIARYSGSQLDGW